MSRSLPSVYSTNDDRDRRNREVHETFGPSVRYAFNPSMPRSLPSVYTPKDYRDRMNREVQQKFGPSVRHAFNPSMPYDINQDPNVQNYEHRFNLMTPGMRRNWNMSERGMNPGATQFAPSRGGKKSKRMRKRTMSKKRKSTRCHYKRRKHGTKRHRRK